MKKCPTCNEEFENDVEVCPNDETMLVAVPEEPVEEPEAEVDDENVEEEAAAEESTHASAATAGQSVSSGNEGLSTFGKASIVILAVLVIGAGLVFWKSKVGGHGEVDLSGMTEKEMQTLVKDFNPMQLKALAENPEQKKLLVENLTQLFAIANQAKKEGLADTPSMRAELENNRKLLLAMNYDRKINSDKGPMPPFGFIGEERIREFWGEEAASAQPAAAAQPDANTNAAGNTNSQPAAAEGAPKAEKDEGFLASALDVVGLGWLVGDAEARRHEAEFQIFLDNRLELLRERGQIQKDQEPSEEEIKQLRDSFAKSRIYYEEAKEKLNSLGSLPEAERKEWEEFEEEYELQAKLQEAQFLAQTYVREKLAKKVQVTEDEVKKYIAEHPEIANDEEKKKKAEDILKRVKEGADFAELAKEFSEDRGSKDTGGLYENISEGQFAPEFEKAALALEPGQVADQLIKTDFGYHIIKLEKKNAAKEGEQGAGPTYDARHILISTMIKDPENPMAREMTVEQFVRAKLEREKQEKVLEEIKQNNPVSIPADFKVPEPSAEDIENLQKQQEEQLKRMLEQQQQQQSGEGEEGAAPPPPPAAAPEGQE